MGEQPRQHAAAFLAELPEFVELAQKRRHLLMQRGMRRQSQSHSAPVPVHAGTRADRTMCSRPGAHRSHATAHRVCACVCAAGMHAVALQCAIDKHQEDAKHPSEDLREALEYARSHARPYDPAAWRPPSSPHGGWAPFQPKPIHPHAAPRSKRGRVAEEARAILLSGM